MSRIVDDEPPIKTGVASQAYRANWDRMFGEAAETTFTISQPPRVDGCPSAECEIRNLCIGSAGCPHLQRK